MRASDGQAQFAYPRNNETIGMVLTILAVLWVGVSLYLVGDFGIFPLIVLILLLSIIVNGLLSRWEKVLLARRGIR